MNKCKGSKFKKNTRYGICMGFSIIMALAPSLLYATSCHPGFECVVFGQIEKVSFPWRNKSSRQVFSLKVLESLATQDLSIAQINANRCKELVGTSIVQVTYMPVKADPDLITVQEYLKATITGFGGNCGLDARIHERHMKKP